MRQRTRERKRERETFKTNRFRTLFLRKSVLRTVWFQQDYKVVKSNFETLMKKRTVEKRKKHTLILSKGTTWQVYDQSEFFFFRTTLTLHQDITDICGSEFSQNNKTCGEVWSSHWWFCSQSTDEILYEHPYSIHECKHHVTSRYLPKSISYRLNTGMYIRSLWM